jgi:MOSC domain-containing protein YiiM
MTDIAQTHDQKTSWQGCVVSLHSCSAKSEPMGTYETLSCKAGVGIEGDRYTLETGTYSARPEEGRQITLFESETLEALSRDHGITLQPDQTRRNVITRGAPLNHLVGRKFRIGNQVVVEGMRYCAPCQYLEDLLEVKTLFKALINRGGLNCRILDSGIIAPGDIIVPLDN